MGVSHERGTTGDSPFKSTKSTKGTSGVQLGRVDIYKQGMHKLWGRKVSDLGFADFLQKLQWIAHKHGKHVEFIDKWYPSSKTCNACEKVKENLALHDRVFSCECGWMCDRDDNSALNIHEVGKTTFAGGEVRQVAA